RYPGDEHMSMKSGKKITVSARRSGCSRRFDRRSRVSRQSGQMLCLISKTAKMLPVLMVALLTSIPLFPQSESVYSSIVGTIKDSSGATVPQVFVVATNVKTNIRVPASAASDEQGRYRIERLVAGTYVVSAERTGFRRFVREGLTISASQTLRLEIP